jgi:hypothetical protein
MIKILLMMPPSVIELGKVDPAKIITVPRVGDTIIYTTPSYSRDRWTVQAVNHNLNNNEVAIFVN